MRCSGRTGSALLTVLWLTAALSAIGLAVASNVRGETERSATNVDDAKSWFVARGGIERAALYMLWGQTYRGPKGEPLFYQPGMPALDFTFTNAEVHVDVVPETAKLGLNTTRPEEIARLLIALGMPEDKAFDTTAAIVDWRTPLSPSQESPYDAFYSAQTPSFQPRHSSFLENEELLLVKGITPEFYYGASLSGDRAALRDCLSVYGSGSVDVNTARLETMLAIGIPPESAASIVAARATHPVADYRELGAIQQEIGAPGARLRLGGIAMYTLRSTARMRGPDGKLSDLRRTVAALVKINFPGNKQNKEPGVEVLRWYDRT